MAKDQSFVFNPLSSGMLCILTVASFLFYGVVGQDKSLLLGPVFVLAYAAITISMIKKSYQLSAGIFKPQGSLPPSVLGSPASVFWLLFLLWGLFLIPGALMPFEAKIRMLFFGAVIGSYLIWGQELTAFKDNRRVLGWLIFIVMLAALYGWVVHIKSPDSILWKARYTDHYDGRLASTYICPNHFAHLMQMLLPFCIALLFIPQAGLYLKILAGYSFLIFLPPLFLTESRAGWLGSMAAVGVVICLMALRRSKKLFAGLVILVPLCSALLLFGAWRYSETFQRRMTPVVQFMEAQSNGGVGSNSPDFRPLTWRDTLDMIAASPVTGYGPGTFRYAYPEFRKRFKGNQIVTGHPHNEYLELTAEFGLIGLGLFGLAWLVGSIWVLIKSLRAEETRHAFLGFAFLGTVAGTMVHSFFDFQMHVFPNAMVFALLAALAIGPLVNAKRSRSKAEDRRRKADDGKQLPSPDSGASRRAERAGLRDLDAKNSEPRKLISNVSTALHALFSWLLAVGFLLLTILSVPVMVSSMLRGGADQVVEYKPISLDQVGQAEKGYKRAVQLDSSNWRAYQGMGKLKHNERWYSLDMEVKVQLAVAEQGWYEQAVRNNPKDPESLIGLGRVLLFLSRAQASAGPISELSSSSMLETKGLDLLREACRYRKFNDQYWWILGVELRKSGHYAEALAVFQKMETVKRTPSSRKNIQWLEKKLTGNSDQRSEGGRQRAEGQGLATEEQGPKTSDLLNQLNAEHETNSGSLGALFQRMEPE